MIESVAYEYYTLALSFDLSSEVKEKCEKILCHNRKLVFDTSNGVNDNRLVISNILKSDDLDGEEIDIFRDVIAWTEALLKQQNKAITPQNIKQELGELIEHIRFPIMGSDEVLNCMKEYPLLLPSSEHLEVVSYVVHGTPMPENSKFNTKIRIQDRLYNVLFKKSGNDTREVRGYVKLKYNKYMSRSYSMALKIDSYGSKIDVSKNECAVGSTISYDSFCSTWIDLGSPISFNTPEDYVTIRGTRSSSNKTSPVYGDIEEQTLPPGLTIIQNVNNFLTGIRLKPV